MSYLSTALQRLADQRHWNHSDIARDSGISKSFISRFMHGECKELSDQSFVGLLKSFAAEPRAQAELVAARCMDVRVGPGAEHVEITVKHELNSQPYTVELPQVPLSQETERAFAWLRSQCPRNPELERHLVGYARLTGMK